jgi:hypothetical protein
VIVRTPRKRLSAQSRIQLLASKLYLFVVFDRVSKFAFAELHDRATQRIAADFLRGLLDHVPWRIHTVLTDNGLQVTAPRGGWRVSEIQGMLAARQPFRAHAFDMPAPSTSSTNG